MNTFFYSATAEKCNGTCRYTTCGKRCLSLLVGLPFFGNLRVLPGGSGLTTPTSMDLRSGDIIILYAENREDIDRLISIKDFFDAFRVILILGEQGLIQYGRHYILNPRYTMAVDENMNRLNAVIDRMVAGSDRPAGPDQRQQEHNYA